MEVGGGGRLYTYRCAAVTTTMTSALRWAAMRAIVMFHNCEGQSHETVSTDHNFWRERRAEADSNRGPSVYQPNTLPLGQTGSLWNKRSFEPFLCLDMIMIQQQFFISERYGACVWMKTKIAHKIQSIELSLSPLDFRKLCTHNCLLLFIDFCPFYLSSFSFIIV